MLQLIASALQSGFLAAAGAGRGRARGRPSPSPGEFSRALAEARLGGDLEDALEAVANRMDSDDLRWTVMAIRIQQGVGGNLAEVLLTIAGTIRERAFLRRQVRALSAEGRLSAYILVALPVLVGDLAVHQQPAVHAPALHHPIGQLMLVGRRRARRAGCALDAQDDQDGGLEMSGTVLLFGGLGAIALAIVGHGGGR